MKRVIKLTEKDLTKIVEKVLLEQSVVGAPNFGMVNTNNDRGGAIRNIVSGANKANINPKGLKIGAGGKYDPKRKKDVEELQQKLIDLGLLKTTTGKPTGYFGELTQKALDRYMSGAGTPVTAKQKEKPKDSFFDRLKTYKPETQKSTGKLSPQVIKQLDYLKKNNLMGDEKFTILDDNQSMVHAFEPGYKLWKSYYVITGRDTSGDKVVVNDFYKKVWDQADFKSLFQGNFNKFMDNINNCIYGGGYKSGDWGKIEQTPAGVFRRTSGILDRYEDYLAQQSDEAVYGKKYISFETLDNKEINTAFHGTQLEPRVKVLTAKDIEKQSCKKRKMSKGCVNFKEPDILELNKWIGPHQKSIWLPSDGSSIVQVPLDVSEEGFSDFWQKYI